MLLFDDIERTNAAPADHQEAHFPFPSRVATPFSAEIRQVLDGWFDHVPRQERADLAACFRSPDDCQHTSAFWELFLHEVFVQLGFGVQLHPLVPGKPTKPDFAVERDNDCFYVEAIVVTDKETDHRSDRKRGQFYDAINQRVCSPNFFLDVEITAEGEGTPPLARIATDLKVWIASLNPNKALIGSDRSMDALPSLTKVYGDWRFRFRAILKRPDRRVTGGPTVGMFGPPKAV